MLPVYEIIKSQGKGPQLYMPNTELIAPDLFVFRGTNAWWMEAKHKTAFTWHRNTGRWVTGIDMRHYTDYCKVNDLTPWDVWLVFLHEGGQAKDSPANSPAGLFGNTLKFLREHENHRSGNWGKGGMVYWALASLQKMAELEEVLPVTGTYRIQAQELAEAQS